MLATEISAAKRERDFYMSRVAKAKATAAQKERKLKVIHLSSNLAPHSIMITRWVESEAVTCNREVTLLLWMHVSPLSMTGLEGLPLIEGPNFIFCC